MKVVRHNSKVYHILREEDGCVMFKVKKRDSLYILTTKEDSVIFRYTSLHEAKEEVRRRLKNWPCFFAFHTKDKTFANQQQACANMSHLSQLFYSKRTLRPSNRNVEIIKKNNKTVV